MCYWHLDKREIERERVVEWEQDSEYMRQNGQGQRKRCWGDRVINCVKVRQKKRKHRGEREREAECVFSISAEISPLPNTKPISLDDILTDSPTYSRMIAKPAWHTSTQAHTQVFSHFIHCIDYYYCLQDVLSSRETWIRHCTSPIHSRLVSLATPGMLSDNSADRHCLTVKYFNKPSSHILWLGLSLLSAPYSPKQHPDISMHTDLH